MITINQIIKGLVTTIIIALMITLDLKKETDLKIIITTIIITHKVIKEIDLETNTKAIIKIIETEIDLEIDLETDYLLSTFEIFILLILQIIIAMNNLNYSFFKNYYR